MITIAGIRTIRGKERERLVATGSLRRFLKTRRAVAGSVILLVLIATTLFSPVLAFLQSPTEADYASVARRPSADHWFGTDYMGRDIFARIVFGARDTLGIALSAVMISMFGGSLVGLASGYFKGRLDLVLMRLIDLLLAFPAVLLAVVFAAVLEPGLMGASVAVGLAYLPIFARLGRGEALAVREREFALAAYACGGSAIRIIVRHILPNVLSPLIVQASLTMGQAILMTAALGFLGLGARPPSPEWGLMISQTKVYLVSSPHMSLFPGFAISITVIAINLIGDGIRIALDPRSQR